MPDDRKRSMFEFPETFEKQKELVEEFHRRRLADRSAAYQWLYDGFTDLWAEHTETHGGLRAERKQERIETRKHEAASRAASFWRRPTPIDWFRNPSMEHVVGTGHERVMEIGCNHGLFTILLSFGNGQAVGVDISPKALAMAEANKQAFGVENVEFVHMDGIDLQFPDDHFDWIVTKDCLEHIHPDDVQPHLRSCLRVLKPGGRLLAITPHRNGYHRHREGHLIYFTYEHLRDELLQAGFAKVRSPLFSRNMPFFVWPKILIERWYHWRGWRRGLGCLGVRSVRVVGHKAKRRRKS